jgi:hypothetical protein
LQFWIQYFYSCLWSWYWCGLHEDFRWVFPHMQSFRISLRNDVFNIFCRRVSLRQHRLRMGVQRLLQSLRWPHVQRFLAREVRCAMRVRCKGRERKMVKCSPFSDSANSQKTITPIATP